MRDFIKENELHSETLGFNLAEVEQGEDNWHRSRAGVITASKAYILLMKDKLAPFPDNVKITPISRGVNEVKFSGESYSGTKTDCTTWVRNKLPRLRSDTRQTYLNELVGSIATGLLPEDIKAKPLQWGKDHEDEARDAYSAATFDSVNDIAFIYRDGSMRAGCSPDGLIDGVPKGLELKAPYSSSVFIDFAANGKIKPEEIVQCQFSMWVTGYECWGFAKFDPRMKNCKKLHFVELQRDETMIEEIEVGYKQMITDMDVMLDKMGMEYGQQWAS